MTRGLLSGRYRYVTSIRSGQRTIAWRVMDEGSGQNCVAAPVGPQRLPSLQAAVGFDHPHLAAVLELIDAPPSEALPPELDPSKISAVVIAEYVSGTNLYQRIKTHDMGTREAVECILRVAQAVQALHARGGIHGAISPRSIVVEPEAGRVGPILSQFLHPTSGTYSARERLQRRGPSPEDDSWALHASLYSALTAVAPFTGSSREELVMSMLSAEPRKLVEFSIDDSALQKVLDAGLVHNPRWRAKVGDLCVGLEKWLDDTSSSPPLAGEWPDDEDEDEGETILRPGPGEGLFLSGDAEAFSVPPVSLHDEDNVRPKSGNSSTRAQAFIPPAPAAPKVQSPPSLAADAEKSSLPPSSAPAVEPASAADVPAPETGGKPASSTPDPSLESGEAPASAARVAPAEREAFSRSLEPDQSASMTSEGPSGEAAGSEASLGKAPSSQAAAAEAKDNVSSSERLGAEARVAAAKNELLGQEAALSGALAGGEPIAEEARKAEALEGEPLADEARTAESTSPPPPVERMPSDALIGLFEQDQIGRRRSRLVALIFVIAAGLVIGWYALRGCSGSTAALPAHSTPSGHAASARTFRG